MSLIPPPKLQKLQAALHAKAKASPNQRFHALYDKVYRRDILGYAYDCCRANGVSYRSGRVALGGYAFRSASSLGPGKAVNVGGGAAAESGRALISAQRQK